MLLLVVPIISMLYYLKIGQQEFEIMWNRAKDERKTWYMKVLIAVIVFAGCCTLAGIPDILSLVALTSFIILISQYVGILKYKIEKSKNKRR